MFDRNREGISVGVFPPDLLQDPVRLAVGDDDHLAGGGAAGALRRGGGGAVLGAPVSPPLGRFGQFHDDVRLSLEDLVLVAFEEELRGHGGAVAAGGGLGGSGEREREIRK